MSLAEFFLPSIFSSCPEAKEVMVVKAGARETMGASTDSAGRVTLEPSTGQAGRGEGRCTTTTGGRPTRADSPRPTSTPTSTMQTSPCTTVTRFDTIPHIIVAVMSSFVMKSKRTFPNLLLAASSCFFHLGRWYCRRFSEALNFFVK